MSKAKRKQLIASLLMLSLSSYPALAQTVPDDSINPGPYNSYIYVGSDSAQTVFNGIGTVSGWDSKLYPAVANFYSGKDVTLNGEIQKYLNNKSGTPAGSSIGAGGAIFSMAYADYANKTFQINAKEIEFKSNSSDRGGAIYNDTGNFVINADSVTFSGNTATNSGAYQGGGAIVNIDGTVSFKDGATVEFIGNKAENGGVGGAILNSSFLANDNGVVDLTNVKSATFSENSATSGGAIANIKGQTGSNPAEIKIANATFSNNSATANGGAVYNETIANLTASKFEKNESGTYGGAIMSTEGSNLTITNGTFTGNKVTGDVKASYGGAIFNQGKMEVSGNFSGNEAGRGGAIYNYTTADTTIKSGTVFENNKSTYGHGSAVYTFNGMTIEDNVEFKNNHANWGGALAVELRKSATMPMPENDTVTIGKEVLFEKNTSRAGGAAIVNTNGNIEIANGAKFIENTSGAGGGAIYNTKDNAAGVDSTISLGSATFENNSTKGDGGAIYNDDKSTVTITGETTFSGNTATGNGGAISNAADSVIALDTAKGNITFTGNNATGNGGAIYNDGTLTLNTDDGNITFTRCYL